MKKILFVDDDPSILDGLKRTLRSERKTWDMDFAASGDQALAAMSSSPVDVVVTDMKMPGMNGAELLQRVKELHPGTIRIVLSGHADMEASMRSVSVSHQFLAKPCEAAVLRGAVTRACNLAELLDDPSLLQTVGSITDLPVLPRVYKALTAALSKEDVDIEEVGEIVEQDVAIAVKILQLVNSSFFGLSREITDLRQATAYLGVNTIRDLVLSFGMFNQFTDETAPTGFSFEREQNQSMLAARIAKKLMSDKEAAEEAFLAAILHGVGKLIMATQLPDALQQVIDAGGGVDRPFHSVEHQLLGTGHAEMGAYLLGIWGMSYPLVEAVANYAQPARVVDQVEFGILGATHVANALAWEQLGQAPELNPLDEDYLAQLGVADRLPAWRAIAEEENGAAADAA